MTTKNILKIATTILLLIGAYVFLMPKIPEEDCMYHVEALKKMRKFDLSNEKKLYEGEEILTNDEIYRFFYLSIPNDSFYYHYEKIKKNVQKCKNQDFIGNEMQKNLDYYETALKICFIRENQLVFEYTAIDRVPIINEASYDAIIQPKLDSYRYDIFDFANIDNDYILNDSFTDTDFKEEIFFRCRICALWERFIHFYKQETGNAHFYSICKNNACINF